MAPLIETMLCSINRRTWLSGQSRSQKSAAKLLLCQNSNMMLESRIKGNGRADKAVGERLEETGNTLKTGKHGRRRYVRNPENV